MHPQRTLNAGAAGIQTANNNHQQQYVAQSQVYVQQQPRAMQPPLSRTSCVSMYFHSFVKAK
jgi:hypothetical protein